MNKYKVTWQIDGKADSPTEAAPLALEMQRDRESIAVIFDVREPSGNNLTIDM